MAGADALSAYTRSEFSDGRWTREIYRRGAGPAVIVIHEMPGIHPQVVDFADRLVDAGLTVVMPRLFGAAGVRIGSASALGTMVKTLCVRREFTAFALDRSSPIVDWLRALARVLYAECGGPGVGAIGMCFTGGFALAMMTEPAVIAPVLAQPSLPLGRRGAAHIDASSEELATARRRLEAEDLTCLGLRFHGDPFVPPQRFETLRRALGDRFIAIELDPADARPSRQMKPHSPLTVHLAERGPTKAAERQVIEFFRDRLGVA